MTDLPELENLPNAEPIKRKGRGWPKGKSRKKPTPAVSKPTPATTPAEFKLPEEFAGLTENSCCDGCTAVYCVISGTFLPAHVEPAYRNHFGQMMVELHVPDATICGHPLKTPVNVFVRDPKVIDRYQRAKKILEHLVIDSRGKGR